jgi:hypothetical protein
MKVDIGYLCGNGPRVEAEKEASDASLADAEQAAAESLVEWHEADPT